MIEINRQIAEDLAQAVVAKRPQITGVIDCAELDIELAYSLVAASFSKHWFVETQDWTMAGASRDQEKAAIEEMKHRRLIEGRQDYHNDHRAAYLISSYVSTLFISTRS